MRLIKTLPLAHELPSLIISAEPPAGLSSTLPDEPPSLAYLDRARVLHVPGADGNAYAGDRNHLVLVKPNVIMNETRLRGLGVAGRVAAGRKSPTTTPRAYGT